MVEQNAIVVGDGEPPHRVGLLVEGHLPGDVGRHGPQPGMIAGSSLRHINVVRLT